MNDCNQYNQYVSDIYDEFGKLDPSKCFKGSEIYPKLQSFNFNNFKDYKSKEYYAWINQNLPQYAFKSDYSTKTFDELCESKDFSLKPQQKFAGRIMNTHTTNNGMLIYHGLGSGKTITSLVIGEAFKFRSVKPVAGTDIIPGRTDAPVLIIVPASLVEQYFNEIIGNINTGVIKSATGEILIAGERQYYLNKTLRNSINKNYKDIEDLEIQISFLEDTDPDQVLQIKDVIKQLNLQNRLRIDEERKKVKRVYEIMSHDTFLNRLLKIESGKITTGEYINVLKQPNGLLIVDEAQNLVSAFGSSYRKLLFAINYHSDPSFRVVLLSGTPIYDKPFEFGLMLNLLRPRMPFPDGFDNFNEEFIETANGKSNMKNIELFKKMCSGYVSYFKGGNPEAYPYKKTILMYHTMNEYQYSRYKAALISEVTKDQQGGSSSSKEEFIIRQISTQKLNDESSTSVYNNSRLYCNIVFPPLTVPAAEYARMSRQAKAEASLKTFRRLLAEESSKSRDNFSNVIDLVRNFSSKFASLIELINKSDGSVFIYSNYVYYGVDAVAAILDNTGYRQFPVKGPLGSYFVWKGATSDFDIQKAKKAYNSPENKDGSILKIILGTQTVMEGVDFKNVRQVHVLDPWWNDSRMQQVIARAIRLCSHRDLPPVKRVVDVFIHLSTLGSGQTLYKLKYRKQLPSGEIIEKEVNSTLQRENIYDRDPVNWIFHEAGLKKGDISKGIESKIFNLAETFGAVNIISNSISKLPDPDLTAMFGTWKGLDSISVEQYMYSRALKKLYINRQFEKAIKEVAIDCEINKNGNIIRLEEKYYQESPDLFRLIYENYSTGETFLRNGIVSVKGGLQANTLTLQDIFLDTAKNTPNYTFTNINTGEEIVLNSSLIIPEFKDIVCTSSDYNLKDVPDTIINLALNKELIPVLMGLKLNDIKQYFFDVEKSHIQPVDPKLKANLKRFTSTEYIDEKQKIINELVKRGIGDVDESTWSLYTLAELKKIAINLLSKKIIE